jgi:hypothetical protein
VHNDVLSAGQDATQSALAVATRPERSASSRPAGRVGGRARSGDLFGLGWVLVSGIAVLVPFLIHGSVFGPFDLLLQGGLTKQPGVTGHIGQNSDLANSLIPWWTLAWQQVHHGHLPLWNPYGGLGMPLAFNWQSAPFSLPALVGYLAPMKYAFTVGVVVNIVVAGSGAYVLGRVLGMGAVASAAVGTVFELSGPITAWLGYPFPSVMSWAGWIIALGLLLLQGRHRAGYIVALALCVAFSLYGGAPEGVVVLVLAIAVFFTVMLLSRTRWLGGSGPILRPGIDLVAATVAGGALAAPFALPGIQLARESVRGLSGSSGALPPHVLIFLGFQSFGGLPIYHDGHLPVFDPYSLFYTENAMYIGVSALVLAGMAVVLHHRRPEVRALSVVTVLCLAVVFVPPMVSLADRLPLLGQISWLRAEMPMALALAVLAGFGINSVVSAAKAGDAARWLGMSFLIATLALLALWIFGRGNLTPVPASIRAHSFIWPAVETVVGLIAAGFLLWVDWRRRRSLPGPSDPVGAGAAGRVLLRRSGTIAGLGLLVVQTAFLVSAGAQMMESSPRSFPQTPATQALAAGVGSVVVADGSPGCRLGIGPNDNDVYGVREFGVYDPIIPKTYFSAWKADTGTPSGVPGLYIFCPPVATVAMAREFGVGYVLEVAGQPGPVGSVFVRHLADEDLYRIPGSGEATTASLSAGKLPADKAVGTPVTVHHPSPSQWRLRTSSNAPLALRFHLTNVPGWQATIDGRPLALEPYAGMMLQARIPAGSHIVTLRYWPQTFTAGILLALVSAALLLALLVVASFRKRRRSVAGDPGPSAPGAS